MVDAREMEKKKTTNFTEKRNMNSALSRESISLFESIKQYDENGNEYWTSRNLSRVLEYADYRNFIKVIEKAKTACANSGQVEADHFVDITEMVIIGSGAPRNIDSVKLSRYACYLIVQNADPSKEIVAQGQTYLDDKAQPSPCRCSQRGRGH